jgi:hypothetical protein
MRLKAEKPLESPADSDPVKRLMERLQEEGFKTDQSTDQSMEEWEQFGEIIFHREEKISFAEGETVFIFTQVNDLDEGILKQTSESVVNTYKAKSATQKALSVLQPATVYHCLVVAGDAPHNELLSDYVRRQMGATFIPVVIVPEINQVVYPDVEEKVSTFRPRIEYLQYLLGERRTTVQMHKPTMQAMWISLAVLVVLVVMIAVSLIAH